MPRAPGTDVRGLPCAPLCLTCFLIQSPSSPQSKGVTAFILKMRTLKSSDEFKVKVGAARAHSTCPWWGKVVSVAQAVAATWAFCFFLFSFIFTYSTIHVSDSSMRFFF